MPQKFFATQRTASKVKAEIVTGYFAAWAKVIAAEVRRVRGKLVYLDLFAGPGRYEDGAESTPLLVLKEALKNPNLDDLLVTSFNDASEESCNRLRKEIESIPEINRLSHKPKVHNLHVSGALAQFLSEQKLHPTFAFVDPFGYKGLTLELIRSLIKDWGSECIFFFNYSRINAGLHNPLVETHMDDLFGKEAAESLRVKLKGRGPEARERLIMEQLEGAIRQIGGRYLLEFTFLDQEDSRPSHKLVFVSKNQKGFEIMQSVMGNASDGQEEGVPDFTFRNGGAPPAQLPFDGPVTLLAGDMCAKFSGQRVTFDELYSELCTVHKRCLRRNFRSALQRLEGEGKIVCASTHGKRKAGTYPEHVVIEFL